MARRITDRLVPMIDAAVEAHGQGEDVCWEVQFAPNEEGGVILILLVWLPAGVVGEHIIGSIAFHAPPPDIDGQTVDANVRTFLDGLRAERAKILTTLQNGHPGPSAGHHGLILP